MKNLAVTILTVGGVVFVVAMIFAALGIGVSQSPNALQTAEYVRSSGLTYEQSQSTLNLGLTQNYIDNGAANKIRSVSDLFAGIAGLIIFIGFLIIAVCFFIIKANDAAILREQSGK